MNPCSPEDKAHRVKTLAAEIGFDLCGIAPPEAGVAWERYREAVDRGYGADMEWLTGNPEVRSDVRAIHPSTRSVVVLAVSYASDTPGYLEQPPSADEGWIARYAQGKDYHVHIRKMLIRLVRAFERDPDLGFSSRQHRIFVDTGPVLEKAFAQTAGIGWVGRNTLLINRERGSWVFLAVVLTPLELAFDTPAVDHCGTCRRCLDACPTGAFPEPYVLDARKCIAHWTIESRQPHEVLEPQPLGQHVFGCDICQEVCPWNQDVEESRHETLKPRAENIRPTLRSLDLGNQEAFKARFPRSAVRRVDADHMATVVHTIRHRNSDT